jgi:hypothetical protein
MFGNVPLWRWLARDGSWQQPTAVEIAFVFPAHPQFFFGEQQYQTKRAR